MSSTLNAADLDRLTAWDTPTICNALEVVAPERRLFGFTTEHLHCLYPDMKPIVGYARTGTIRASAASDLESAAMKEKRLAYYGYIAEGHGPTVVVLQDVDSREGFGAFWGEVNTHVHRGLGALGCVTNGSIRDLDACAENFQLLAGRVGPSHAHVHIVDFAKQVNVFGMVVSHEDVIHADRHGAVVIPRDVVKQVPDAIDLLTRREAVILEAAVKPEFGIEMLRQAMSDQADIH